MRTIITAAAPAALLLVASSVQADTPQTLLKQADAAEKNGDFAAAEKLYLQAAKTGDAESQYLLGEMLEKGKGVDQDKDAAPSWYRKSAAQGNHAGQQEAARLEGELKTPP